jgi:DNA repair protein RadC
MNGWLPRYRITDLAIEQRPRERLAAWGAEHHSDAELVAILLGSGIRGSNALRLAEAVLAAVTGFPDCAGFRWTSCGEHRESGPRAPPH